ncbi:MAG: hypothetical protein A2Z86_11020 [Candidatus Glassbacteria bacterium GWA2_58_10]|uniref:Aspartate racemase n=1 Tax=Candidatus Glassbacteria bacterium GWA2_58_10 TaxID=1817865 RepID=A0A1F5YBW1_9BACT|nr:MAG: hypothetical protein A2Z86_11020 [Candidatus Glassbacteria bacterium GWA2_58_10]
MKIPVIGIVGGVGPYAGLELNRKVFENTLTDGSDQSHLEVLLFSAGARVPDRTEYLLGREKNNPAEGLYQSLAALSAAGAELAAIACNTAHSAKIIGPLKERISAAGLKIELLDLIEETGVYILRKFGPGAAAGLLATEGTLATGVYDRLKEESLGGIRLIAPEPEIMSLVHRAIYDREYGIKAFSAPVTARARADCLKAVEHLAGRGARLAILGCTELPLALPERNIGDLVLIDPGEVVARSLIRRAAPEKLKPES